MNSVSKISPDESTRHSQAFCVSRKSISDNPPLRHRAHFCRAKQTDAVLIIDAYAVLASDLRAAFQPVTRRHGQVFQRQSGVQDVQLFQPCRFSWAGNRLHLLSSKAVRYPHPETQRSCLIITRRVSERKAYLCQDHGVDFTDQRSGRAFNALKRNLLRNEGLG